MPVSPENIIMLVQQQPDPQTAAPKPCLYFGGLFCNDGQPPRGLQDCYLFNQAVSQANIGSKNADGSDGGPFWPRGAWDNYVDSTRHVASGECGMERSLFTALDAITQAKDQQGEFK